MHPTNPNRCIRSHTILGLCVLLITCANSALAQDSLVFKEAQTLPNSGANDVVLVDIDNDGDPDIATANGFWNQPLPSQVWLNNGEGAFRNSGQELGMGRSWGVSAADVNGDGHTDLFMANGYWTNGDSSRLWINRQGTFVDSGFRFGRANTSDAELADLNGDGTPDLFMANHPYSNGRGGGDQVWFNHDSTFVRSEQTLDHNNTARHVELFDINQDKDMDAIVLHGDTLNAIWLNDGRGNFTSHHNIGSGENVDMTICDIEQDGDPDIIIAKGAWGNEPKGIAVWVNQGGARFILKQRAGTFDGYGITSGDLNADGYPDLVVINDEKQRNQVFLNNGRGRFNDAEISIGKGGNAVAVGDLNDDGLEDIVVVGNDHTNVYLQQVQ